MLAIDRHAWNNRWQRYHPAEKLLLAGGLLLVSITLPPLTTAPLVLLIMALATVMGAGVPVRAFLWVIALPCAFLLSSVAVLAVSLDFTGGIRLAFSPAGMAAALQVMMRSLAAVSCLSFLTLTTPIIDLLPLLRRLGVPSLIVELMLLVYRLVFVFAERVASGRQAQAARLGYCDFRTTLRSLGLLTVNLWQRSLARARCLQIGLEARGYDGRLRVLTPVQAPSRPRLIGIGGLLGVTGLAGVWLDRIA